MAPISVTAPAASLAPAAGASASPLSQIAASFLLTSELESRTSESIGKITAGNVSPFDLLEAQLNLNEFKLQANILSGAISGTTDPLEDIAKKGLS